MSLPPILQGLALPIVSAPMFIVSYPDLVVAQCAAGIVGSFPALNARPAEMLDTWLTDIRARLDTLRANDPERIIGPIAVNQIIHASNPRLSADMKVCVKHRVPILITSLRAPQREMVEEVHGYGGIVLHDVTTLRHAEKALEAGVDGLIVVAAGAGGHAGTLSPFALVAEVRRIFSGPLILSGAISTGDAILAAQAMGADLAYIGTRFIATQEAHAADTYKQGLVDASAADVIYTDHFTGIPGNYLKQSIVAAGLDPAALIPGGAGAPSFSETQGKAWKDIWGAGQGVGSIHDLPTVGELLTRLSQEYIGAKQRLGIAG